MNFANGMLNLTNWLGNVIMPTVAGLFAAAAIFNFTKGRSYQHPGVRCPGIAHVLGIAAGA